MKRRDDPPPPTGCLNLTEAAKRLGVKKPYLYGMLMILGIEPELGSTGRPGKPPRLLSEAQVDRVRARLESARTGRRTVSPD